MILDALRKAEAERQRGAVPGLHDTPAAAPAAGAELSSRPAWLLPAALLLLAGVAGLWWAWRAVPSAAAPAAARVPAPASAPSPAPLPAAAPATAWPQVVSAPPAPPPAPPAPAPVPPAATTPAAPIVTQVRRLAELPAEQRRELPPLVVSGSVWSEQATARFVVLDGQVLREGDRVAPGLVLVKLAPRSATLRWRDGLVEVQF